MQTIKIAVLPNQRRSSHAAPCRAAYAMPYAMPYALPFRPVSKYASISSSVLPFVSGKKNVTTKKYTSVNAANKKNIRE
jgi:hypothetical protein